MLFLVQEVIDCHNQHFRCTSRQALYEARKLCDALQVAVIVHCRAKASISGNKMAGNEVDSVSMEETTEENDQQETTQDIDSEKSERTNRLPFTRIKHLIKLDPDVNLASQDAVVLIAKAAVSLLLRLSLSDTDLLTVTHTQCCQ